MKNQNTLFKAALGSFGLLLILMTEKKIEAQEPKDKPVVAVLNFTVGSGQFYLKDLEASFPAKLKTELSRSKKILIVERQKLDDVLKEQDFSMSDLSEDRDKQARVGQLLGADYLITGVISESGKKLRIDAAIIHTTSGKVLGEKVIGPSKEYINAMTELLAQNIVYNLTGEGDRMVKRKMPGASSATFFMSTAVLGAGTTLAWMTHKNWYDKYKKTPHLDQMDRYYNKAQKWYVVSGISAGVTAVSLTMYLYAVIKNQTTDREILASAPPSQSTFWVLMPQWNAQQKALGVEMTFRF